eukprot:CAMPEP_0202910104 /NCGR_PEP_ID=MMETSP1392-20130828/51118_1 /ASSEMBLY_ACC=CAM_ASM_000868 /TAXON_ID=225041 /ORGANISM="Chlamydomonas chlamydogama, Strain SAG 11-48b" /LENGTH=110 /DNA_ID=CAMNT_0049600095 /DNA_START=38 /DNA_END=366 /DNA_ORIENTATION=-
MTITLGAPSGENYARLMHGVDILMARGHSPCKTSSVSSAGATCCGEESCTILHAGVQSRQHAGSCPVYWGIKADTQDVTIAEQPYICMSATAIGNWGCCSTAVCMPVSLG